MAAAPLEFDQPDQNAGPPVRNEVVLEIGRIVRSADMNSDRSKQASLGPSEVWDNCLRRQAYRIAGWPTINYTSDPWAAIVGTASHAWLAQAFHRDNIRNRRIRWLIETRVMIRRGMWGTCDLFDLDTFRVLDHKIVGEYTMRKIRSGNEPENYKYQLQLYGLGWENRGIIPKEVGLVAYPRGGVLAGIHCEPVPYDREMALVALARMDSVAATVRELDLANHPENFELIEPTRGHSCMYCAFWNASAKTLAQGCRGMLEKK